MSNQQIFDNKALRKEFINEGGDPKHPIIDKKGWNQGHMALIIVALWTLRIIVNNIKCNCCKSKGKNKNE